MFCYNILNYRYLHLILKNLQLTKETRVGTSDNFPEIDLVSASEAE